MSTIGSWFASVHQSRQAMLDLLTSGLPRQNISVVIGAGVNAPRHSDSVESSPGTNADHDSLASIRASDFVQSLQHAGTLTIPDIGLIVAAGPLADALNETSGGTTDGRLYAALVRIGVPPDQAQMYEAELRRGGALVAVQCDDIWESIVRGVFRHSADPSLREQEERVGPTPGREVEADPNGGPVSTSIGALTAGTVPGSWGATDAVFEDQAGNIVDDQHKRGPAL